MRKTVIYSIWIVLLLVFALVTALHNDVSKANQARKTRRGFIGKMWPLTALF